MKKHTFVRVMSFVFILAAILSAAAFVSLAEEPASAAVSAEAVKISRGEEITFTVSVKAEDVSALIVAPVFDESLFTLVGGKSLDESKPAAYHEAQKTVIVLYDTTGSSPVDLDGGAVSFTLEAKEDATLGGTSVCASVVITVNKAAVTVGSVTGAKTEVICGADEHNWQEATCSSPKTCLICGTVEGGLGHKFIKAQNLKQYEKAPATCTTEAEYYYSCSECGAAGTKSFKFGKPLGHEYSPATCTEKEKCVRCGVERGDYLHNYVVELPDEAYLKTPATCTETAVYYKSCECGAKGSETFSFGELKAHNYIEKTDSEYLKSSATCTAAAVYYESCADCGIKGADTFPSGGTIPHTFTTPYKFDSEGHYTVCKCGARTESEAHIWNGGEMIEEPTEEKEGKKSYSCTKCLATKTETVPALAPAPDTEEVKEEGNPVVVWIVCIVIILAAMGVVGAVIFRKAPAAKAEKPEASEENTEPSEENTEASEETAEETEETTDGSEETETDDVDSDETK